MVSVLAAMLRRAFRDLGDLALPCCCVSCGSGNEMLCPSCRRQIQAGKVVSRALPDAARGPLAVCCAADYAGSVRECVLAFKRTGSSEIGVFLTGLATVAIANAVAAESLVGHSARPNDSIAVVPIPSGSVTRSRAGVDVPRYLAERATSKLRTGGRNIGVAPLIRTAHRGNAQKGLSAPARSANAESTLIVDRRRIDLLARLAAKPPRVILFDDVVTTGASLLVGRAALGSMGLKVNTAAAVASVNTRS